MKLDIGCSALSILSATETRDSRSSIAVKRTSTGYMFSPLSRSHSNAARPSSLVCCGFAGVARPKTTPAIVAWIPDSKVASQSAVPKAI